ncbi:2-isopropylmalate synthase [Kitasatospora sp. NPDC018058]|uniref:2-isopropylmalate synthase n=1 Tax=Kitasatospora sp. NPDC018058 TaxID=3364025 RepID=UPI0037BEADDD
MVSQIDFSDVRALQRASPMNTGKYRPYRPVGLADRNWPDRQPTRAPLWCSVDLRDGNQALMEPMAPERKLRMFRLLVGLGFKEIEVGYPTASADDYEFIRMLVAEDEIPEDVVIQVMAPIRGDFIERTVKALQGVPQACVQIFNPTSTTQRRVVFGMDQAQTLGMAVRGAEELLRLRDSLPGTRIHLQYAPESFTQTEPDFALDVCNAVLERWLPATGDQLRINLPATVEVFPPHEFADRIEYVSRGLAGREQGGGRVLLSVHPHNDRGSGVAAAELAVLAGADRVEGCLFGQGERTGNVCLVTLAMNLFSQGVDPMLDLRDLDGVRQAAEECTRMPVGPRHPWVGDFVYTSFAGGHQDAISKGLRARAESEDPYWDVPYLPIDPMDVGRDYRALIRINSQSGKGGIAYLLRSAYGLELPRRFQIELASVLQREAEESGGEVGAERLWEIFRGEFTAAEFTAAEDAAVEPAEFGGIRFGTDPEETARRALELLAVPATVREVSVQAVEGRGHVGYCEVVVGRRGFWGAGIADEPGRAVAEAARAAAGRVPRGLLAQAGHGRQLDLVGA